MGLTGRNNITPSVTARFISDGMKYSSPIHPPRYHLHVLAYCYSQKQDCIASGVSYHITVHPPARTRQPPCKSHLELNSIDLISPPQVAMAPHRKKIILTHTYTYAGCNKKLFESENRFLYKGCCGK